MPADILHAPLKICRIGYILTEQAGRDEILENVPGGAGGFIRVAWVTVGSTFTPTGEAFGADGNEETFPVSCQPEGGLEGRNKRHGEVIKADRVEFQGSSGLIAKSIMR